MTQKKNANKTAQVKRSRKVLKTTVVQEEKQKAGKQDDSLLILSLIVNLLTKFWKHHLGERLLLGQANPKLPGTTKYPAMALDYRTGVVVQQDQPLRLHDLLKSKNIFKYFKNYLDQSFSNWVATHLMGFDLIVGGWLSSNCQLR